MCETLAQLRGSHTPGGGELVSPQVVMRGGLFPSPGARRGEWAVAVGVPLGSRARVLTPCLGSLLEVEVGGGRDGGLLQEDTPVHPPL